MKRCGDNIYSMGIPGVSVLKKCYQWESAQAAAIIAQRTVTRAE